jgi:hypothetical protein
MHAFSIVYDVHLEKDLPAESAGAYCRLRLDCQKKLVLKIFGLTVSGQEAENTDEISRHNPLL